jgi:peptidyl-prolyl cis-trans isomerase C
MALQHQSIRRSLMVISALTLFATAVSAADSPKSTPPATVSGTTIEGPVARINGKEISAIELKRVKQVLLAGQPGVQIPPDKQKEFDLQALEQLISAELLYQAGQKLEVKDLDKLVETKFSQDKSRFANEKDFIKAIGELNMNEKDLRDYTRREVIISNFIVATFVPKITVSEQESRKFYDQNTEKFHQDEQVRASHILIGVDAKAGADEKRKAREKAEKLRKELAAGAEFVKLARDNSTCPSSKQGGDLGFFGKGQMVPPFEKAAFALKTGESSDIVETQFGYHIIKVTEKKAAETVAFDVVRPRIEDYLKAQKVKAAVGDYLAETRKSAKIEVLLK